MRGCFTNSQWLKIPQIFHFQSFRGLWIWDLRFEKLFKVITNEIQVIFFFLPTIKASF